MSDMPVIVGTDGSDYAAAAVDTAVREAVLRQAPLRIIYAFAPRYSRFDISKDGVVSPMLAECERIVEEEKERVLQRHRDVDITTSVELANPAETLIRVSHEAQLLVLGARGLGAIRRLFLGSVAHAVAAASACPVFVVRKADDSNPGPVVAGIPPDAGASDVLDYALPFAKQHKRSLLALHARQHAGTHMYDIETKGMQEVITQRLAAVDKRTKERYTAAIAKYPEVDSSFRSTGQHAIDALLDAGENAHVVIIGRCSAVARSRTALGSVADSVLAEAARVIVVPVSAAD